MWIPAKELEITHAEDAQKWKWVSYDGCSLNDVAELLRVHWLEIKAEIDLEKLQKTSYSAFLVFKLQHSSQNLEQATACVRFVEEIVHWELEEGYIVFLDKIRRNPREKGRFPQRRSDEWMEIKLGEFSNTLQNNGKVLKIRLRENDTSKKKSGLIVRGIDLRPNFLCDCLASTEAEFFDCIPYQWYETPK